MDTDLEIFSLKDSLWKLNTRVLLLENFITQQFGTNALRNVHKQKSHKSSTITTTTKSQKCSPKKRVHSRSSTDKQLSRQIVTTRVNYDEKEESSDDSCSENPNRESDDMILLVPKTEVTDENLRELEMETTEMNSMDSIQDNINCQTAQNIATTEEIDAPVSKEGATPRATYTPGPTSKQKTGLSNNLSFSDGATCGFQRINVTAEPISTNTKVIKRRAKRSSVYAHFEIVDDIKCICNHCGKQYPKYSGGSNSTMLKHLRSKHPDLINKS